MSQSSSVLSDLCQWWCSHGHESNGSQPLIMEPRPSSLGGNGLFLNTSSPQSVVATIPSSLLLTASTIHRYAQAHDPSLARALDHLTPPDSPLPPSRLAIMVFLIRFYALEGTQINQLNPWRPYLLALPTLADLHVPTQYEDQELALLHGTSVPRLVAAKRAKLVDELELILSAFAEASHSPSTGAPRSVNMRQLVTLDQLIWADAVFWSRVLEVPSTTVNGTFELAMIPILDFANHSFDCPTLRWDRDSATGSIRMSLTSTLVNANDELFLCYDPDKSNEQLLFTHGFVIPGNNRGYVSVDAMPELNMLAAQSPELAHRVQWAVNRLKVRPVILVSAAAEMEHGLPFGIEWMESNLDQASMVTVLLVAVDDAGAAHAISSATEPAAGDHDGSDAQVLVKLAAALKDRVGTSPDAVERAGEFLQVVCSRVLSELQEIHVDKVTVRGKGSVVVTIQGVGEDGKMATVGHELAHARFEAIAGYKEQVKAVVASVVQATAGA